MQLKRRTRSNATWMSALPPMQLYSPRQLSSCYPRTAFVTVSKITARVTLASGVTDIVKSFRHLKQDLGFQEVGFAPVTTSLNQLYAINDKGTDSLLDRFHPPAQEYLEHALRGEAHGVSNVSDTLAELCPHVNRSHPCGAGLGLMGVGPSGDIAPCYGSLIRINMLLVIPLQASILRSKSRF
jgi:hypothetical protein